MLVRMDSVFGKQPKAQFFAFWFLWYMRELPAINLNSKSLEYFGNKEHKNCIYELIDFI